MPSTNVQPGLVLVTQVMDQDHEILGFFVSWIRMLARFNHTVTVLCWKHGTCKDMPANVQILELPKGASRRWFMLMRHTFVHRREFQTFFVHMITPVTASVGWWLRLLNKRVVQWYTHGHVPLSLRITEVLSHRLLTATPESLRIASKKVHVVGHGIDTDYYKPTPDVDRVAKILVVGRVTPKKCLEECIEVARKIREHAPDLAFTMSFVGSPYTAQDQQYQEKIRGLVKSLNLEASIEWAGKHIGASLMKHYSTSAVLLSTSATGSLDKVVLEAMACETPVIATGEAYRHLKTIHAFPSATSREAIELMIDCLRHPRNIHSAREEVIRGSGLAQLTRTIHDECFPDCVETR